MQTATAQYELVVKRMEELFVEKYYPDYEDNYYSIGSEWNRPVFPRGPLDIGEWSYIRDVNNIWTALHNDIPKDIVLEWYDRYCQYDSEEVGMMNLYTYYRQNFDPEKYEAEKELDRIESRQRMLETSYLLDDELDVERGTSIKTIDEQIAKACE